MLSYHLLTRLLTHHDDAPATRIACAVSSVVHGLVPHDTYVGLADQADTSALTEAVLRARVSLLLSCDCSPLLDLVKSCRTEQQFVAQWNGINAKLPLGVTTQIQGVAVEPMRTCLSGRDSCLRERIMGTFLEQLRGGERRPLSPANRPLSGIARDVLGRRDPLVELVDYLFECPTAELSECVAELGGSKRTLQRHLRSLGVTFVDLRQAVRLTLSKDLLQRRALSMTSIAITSGFYDAPHFCRALRASCGMTPSDYQALSVAVAS